MIGWATQNGGTTGGAGGNTVTVFNAADFLAAISSSQALTVQLATSITLNRMNLVASNKTIVGVGDVTISGGGLNIKRARNVIIRNLTFFNWTDDAINVEYSTNVWVDHNTFNHGYDGCVDIKRASDFVTVSWNVFVNHNKVSLVGHSDNNTAEDMGHLRVTYHHNWFNGTVQRHPRVRFGNPVHVYNNYYVKNSGYSIATTMNAGVLVEGNYFDRVRVAFNRQDDSNRTGNLSATNNVFVGVQYTGDATGTVAPIPYRYFVDDPPTIVERIKAQAGAGAFSAG